MLETTSVLYIAVDELIPSRGAGVSGLDEFTAALDHQGIPSVWLTSRSRIGFDEPRRKYGHTHPFIAEGGCAVYLPEGYFHLKPAAPSGPGKKAATIRFGRFTCIPIAEPLPAAKEALETLAEDTGTAVVTLGNLSPRELAQNTGLPQRDAELARQRDFDEVFFFAGAADLEIERFVAEGRKRNLQLRPNGMLWSVAVGASERNCIRELGKLYDRALRHHAHVVGLATEQLAPNLFPYCERRILLRGRKTTESESGRNIREIPLQASDLWEQLLGAVSGKK